MQWITTTCYVSAVSNNSLGRVAALVCRQVSVTLAAIAIFASRPIDSLLLRHFLRSTRFSAMLSEAQNSK